MAPARIKPEMVEGDGKALRFTTFFPGILYNVHSAPWVPRIETLSDLLKPEYKGQFVTTPYLAAFDVMLADDVWGVAKTEDFVPQDVQADFRPARLRGRRPDRIG